MHRTFKYLDMEKYSLTEPFSEHLNLTETEIVFVYNHFTVRYSCIILLLRRLNCVKQSHVVRMNQYEDSCIVNLHSVSGQCLCLVCMVALNQWYSNLESSLFKNHVLYLWLVTFLTHILHCIELLKDYKKYELMKILQSNPWTAVPLPDTRGDSRPYIWESLVWITCFSECDIKVAADIVNGRKLNI